MQVELKKGAPVLNAAHHPENPVRATRVSRTSVADDDGKYSAYALTSGKQGRGK